MKDNELKNKEVKIKIEIEQLFFETIIFCRSERIGPITPGMIG